ncbi:acyl-CoA thioesterase domain-containing protein [Nocardioides sp. TF02-7]|uniref:acyl-CoA thioesterase domain-containing protein n=1 Tax=Nocardioides sp. TF02-7 TaxID=2917724 RepID=UPI001F060954|nr:acyl-CoA thioesterase domain-containing protein [Nocardioides sp. TF02-7]UMG93687.1 thioesterase family protein [Nocardioides sp. TF02-7]
MTVTRDPDARETDPRWSGFDGLFGGYVVGLLADTAVARSAYRLVSLTANFVSRVAVGPVAVRTETLHRGRSTELLRLLLEQDGRVRVHATAELLHLPPIPHPLRRRQTRRRGCAPPPRARSPRPPSTSDAAGCRSTT